MELSKLLNDRTFKNFTDEFDKLDDNTLSLKLLRKGDIMKIKHIFFELKDSNLFDVDINYEILNKSKLKLFIRNELIFDQSLLFLINLNPIKIIKNSVLIELPYSWFTNEFIMIACVFSDFRLELNFENHAEHIFHASVNLEYTFAEGDDRLALAFNRHIAKSQFTKSTNYQNTEKICNFDIEIDPKYYLKGYFIEGNLENLLKLTLKNMKDAKTSIRFEYNKLMMIANSKYINKNLIYVPINEEYDYTKMENKYYDYPLKSIFSFEFSESPKYINIHVLQKSTLTYSDQSLLNSTGFLKSRDSTFKSFEIINL